MASMSPIDVAQILYDVGFRAGQIVNGVAIIGAETAGTFDPLITNEAGNVPPSVDRGLWQINSHWHAEVSDECAFDPVCASQAAFRISQEGTSWSQWSAYKNESYKKYLALAVVAQDAARRIRTLRKEHAAEVAALNEGHASEVAALTARVEEAEARLSDVAGRLNAWVSEILA